MNTMRLLLTALLAAATVSASPENEMTALSFQGGGFRAQIVATTVLSGLASLEDTKRPNDQADGADVTSGLPRWINEVDVVSSSSGGSWAAAQMIYSPSYMQLMSNVSAHPDNTSSLFWDNYYSKWAELQNINQYLSGQ